MVQMPAKCTRCDLVFRDNGIVIVNSRNTTLGNNTTRCPRCNGVARIVDGNFDVTPDEEIVVNSAPEWTTEILRQLEYEFVKVMEDPGQDVAAEVEAALPAEVRPLWRRAASKLSESEQMRFVAWVLDMIGRGQTAYFVATGIYTVLKAVIDSGGLPF